MKKTNIMKGLMAIILAAAVFVSCQKEQIKLNPALNSIESDVSVSSVSAGDYFTYSIDEICLGDEVTVTFDNGYNNNCGNIQIQMSTDGGTTWYQVVLTPPVDGAASYTFMPPAEGSYDFRGSWTASGKSCKETGSNIGFKEGTATIPVTVVNCCTNDLSVNLECGETNTLSITFTAEEAGPIVIQGGLTHGTTIVTASSNILTQNTTHPSVLNSNANVTRWEGEVTDCEEVIISITFTGGNGIGSWSAKRGEEVLGSTEEEAC